MRPQQNCDGCWRKTTRRRNSGFLRSQGARGVGLLTIQQREVGLDFPQSGLVMLPAVTMGQIFCRRRPRAVDVATADTAYRCDLARLNSVLHNIHFPFAAPTSAVVDTMIFGAEAISHNGT